MEAAERQRIAELVREIRSTVALGHQTGPFAYAGEDFERYLREATQHCDEILGLLTLNAEVTRADGAED